MFNHKAIAFLGGVNAAVLGFKRNVRILGFLSETLTWERADARLWERKFGSPNLTETLQILLGVKEKAPILNHRQRFQAQCLTPFCTCDSHHIWLIWTLCIHTGNSQMVILVAALQETAKVFHVRAQVGVITSERISLFPLFKHWAFSSEGV